MIIIILPEILHAGSMRNEPGCNMKKNIIIDIFILLFILVSNPIASAESPPNQPPEAYFTASPSSGQSPLTVQFDASKSVDTDGKIVSYSWNFGDGGSGSANESSHTYKNPGRYSASLTVTDDGGETGIYSTLIIVTSGESLSVTIIPDQVSVGADVPSIIRVRVNGKGGAGIAGAKVALSSNAGGKFDPDSGNTDPSGQFSSSFTASEGTYRISATATKAGISKGNGETTVRVLKLTPLFMKIVAAPESISPGGSSSIRIEVKGSDGSPIPDANVTLTSGRNGTLVPDSGKTDSKGQFTSKLTGSAEGTIPIKAVIRKKGFSEKSGEVMMEVRPGNNVLFIPVFLLIIIAGVIGYELWGKGKLQVIPFQTSIPCDGKSTLPVKVQFVDPSGKPKIQRKDCHVEIKASSGTIQNAVIPEGKDSAETILTSSHICGLVYITARSGFQKARTTVNFAGNIAGIVMEVSPAKIPADGISISSVVIKITDDKGNFITSLDEWGVEMTTTLGTITTPVKIPPGTLSGIGILTSCKTIGTATVTAAMGKLHSEKKVVFEELPDRYCMHCGDALKRDMKICPGCKKTPPPDNEIKECNSCSGIIPASALFCDKCGAKQPV